ncbi:hypothetical protein DPMN_132565 [Dreissena polymorpha]|uniref:Integrase core domain-containing protein n=1 Tax=Dreissena polymorpha TaxID=45954 RepID=A0A9D4FWD7_DREPO|nr:hypothetical protein DPMN_132565 [Dreissena polymorpha]
MIYCFDWIERLWREVWNGATSLYYSLFYNMEDEGILDVSNDIHIALLHLVFLPRNQSHLDRFAEALRRRPLRTENKCTPIQLWITGPRSYSSDHEQVLSTNFTFKNNRTKIQKLLFKVAQKKTCLKSLEGKMNTSLCK